jgi:uncharacterized protein (UPF0332 family)
LSVERALERSRNDLEAARHLLQGGFGAQAVSRTYYSAFHAAEAALLVLGETRSKHSGVVAAFGQLVVRQGGFDEGTGRTLRSLFERRQDADYAGAQFADEEAEAAIADAERFVTSVEEWIAGRTA